MSGPAERLMSRSEPADHDRLARCAGNGAARRRGTLSPFYPPGASRSRELQAGSHQ